MRCAMFKGMSQICKSSLYVVNGWRCDWNVAVGRLATYCSAPYPFFHTTSKISAVTMWVRVPMKRLAAVRAVKSLPERCSSHFFITELGRSCCGGWPMGIFWSGERVLYDVLLYGKLDAQRDPRILCEHLDPIYTRFAHGRCTGGSKKGWWGDEGRRLHVSTHRESFHFVTESRDIFGDVLLHIAEIQPARAGKVQRERERNSDKEVRR